MPTVDTVTLSRVVTFTLALSALPGANVQVNVASPLPGGAVTPTSLTFTTGNGTTPQTVTVTGGVNMVKDGDGTIFWVDQNGVTQSSRRKGMATVFDAIKNGPGAATSTTKTNS